MTATLLVRYGRIPEVARVRSSGRRDRGDRVVVRTQRGMELATVLETIHESPDPLIAEEDSDFVVVRDASADDQFQSTGLATRAATEFSDWQKRIDTWNLDLQLVDLEWTLDRQKLILYVLNERGPECTKLAIQAAAAGLGLVEVQPVSREGLVALETGGGCGSGGCGTGGCSH